MSEVYITCHYQKSTRRLDGMIHKRNGSLFRLSFVRKVRSTHESLDHATAKQLHELYETTIDFGAHPNQMGLLAFLRKSETEKEINYQVGILCPETVSMVSTLRLAVAVGTLKIFQLIFPERFRLMSLDVEIETIVGELNSVFRSYVPRVHEPGVCG